MVRRGLNSPKPDRPEPRWALRDGLAAIALFAATAGVVLWQNTHVAVLWDLSYVLDTAARIASGQLPYRDFPLVHAPLTFLIQAAIVRLAGRVFFYHVLYAAAVGGLGTVLTWRIVFQTLRGRVASAWTVALLSAAPLTVLGIYCILPQPEYDCDCAFWILVAVWLLLRADANKRSVVSGVVAGVAIVAPLFFKQNIGLPFLAAAIGAVAAVLAISSIRRTNSSADARALWGILAGAGSALATAALALHRTAGLGNYIHWTIRFAAQRRMPGSSMMLGVYRDPSLAWTLPCVVVALVALCGRLGKQRWARIAASALLASPFVFTLASLLVYDDADERGDSLLALWPLLLLLAVALTIWNLFKLRREPSLRLLLPLILLAAIHGAFLSQQLWGSTYAIWPLLVLLVAQLLVFLDERTVPTARWFTPTLASLVSVTLLLCGALYTASEERLSYVQLPDGPPAHSVSPALAGLATPGPYIPEFDELLRYAEANIPFNDGLVLLPGEEPFFFATGRAPRFPITLFDPTTQPYSPAELASLARSKNIRWLIVKRDLQIKEDPTPNREATLQALTGEFTLAARLRGYDVYQRTSVFIRDPKVRAVEKNAALSESLDLRMKGGK